MIPESPFYLEGEGGLFEYIEQRLKENGHALIVLAEGAGQEYIAKTMQSGNATDASGNRLLLDVGLWMTQNVKVFGQSFFFLFLFLLKKKLSMYVLHFNIFYWRSQGNVRFLLWLTIISNC